MWGTCSFRFSDGQCHSSIQNPSPVCLPSPSGERKPKLLCGASKDGPLRSDCPPSLPPHVPALGCSGTFHSREPFRVPESTLASVLCSLSALSACCPQSGGPLCAPSTAPPSVWLTLVCMCVQSLSPVRLFATPWAVAHQAPLAWDFPGKNILEWVAISCSRRSS